MAVTTSQSPLSAADSPEPGPICLGSIDKISSRGTSGTTGYAQTRAGTGRFARGGEVHYQDRVRRALRSVAKKMFSPKKSSSYAAQMKYSAAADEILWGHHLRADDFW